MKKLPFSIILLVLFLTVVFNLERIAPGGTKLVDIGTFVYILSTVAIVFTILLRSFTGMKPIFIIMMWGLFYLFLRLAFFNENPFWGQNYSYVTITEIAILLVGVVLTLQIGSQLMNFHDAVEMITFANSPKSPKLSDELDNINSEIYRSRRYNHPLTMIMFQPTQDSQQLMLNKSVQDEYKTLTSRFVAISVAKVLRENIRLSDQLIEQPEKGRYIVLTPETNKAQSARVINKIREAARSLGIDVTVGVSTFPEDAPNLEDLLKQAEEDLVINQNKLIDPPKNETKAEL